MLLVCAVLKEFHGEGYQLEIKIMHVLNEYDDVSNSTARIFQHMDALRGGYTQDAKESDMLILASKTYINLPYNVVENPHEMF